MQLLDGKIVSQAVKDRLKVQTAERVEAGKKVPHLAAVLIGNNGASETYVGSKVRSCAEIGFKSTLIRLEESISEAELLYKLDELNADFDVDGILVQLPLPVHIAEEKVIERIFASKDVDGFHPESVGRMVQGLPAFYPATPYGILLLLEHYNVETKGKHAVVIGRSNIVGRPISIMLSKPEYPGNLADLTHEDVTRFGEEFIRDTQIYRKGGTPFFIDKMPNNFRHIGLINMILPNAKIIDARRGAMGCCFSGFKQLFAEGQEFTYGLEEVGQYYTDYVQLMDHWDNVLPGKILRVRYEEVVADLETQVRRLLDYCGLPFEEACLNFHQTERAVRTASSEQVRQPIFKSGVDQWENFSEFLDPLRKKLGPELAAT